jgi:dTDP-4-dehydrorhamnose 3,5-epimerase-like enzyme
MNTIKIKKNKKIITKNKENKINGFLIPIFNINEKFFKNKDYPKQVYVTVVNPGSIKGPHLHYKRRGFFTCIHGNVKFIIKIKNSYKVVYSGEKYNFKSLLVPKKFPVAIQCLGNKKAIILNMPNPAWSPKMNDEHVAEFKDYNF